MTARELLLAPLTAPGTFAVLLGLVVAGFVVRRSARRHRRRLLRIAGLTLAIISLTATAADATNAWFGYLPRLGDVGTLVGAPASWPVVTTRDLAAGAASPRARTGGVLDLALPDRGSGFGPTTALAWLPPQYFTEPHRRFAVVYLAHGSPGVPQDWFRGGDAARIGERLAGRGLPLILVAPRLSHGWLDDPECVDGRREAAATHLLVDVVPGVDAALRTSPVRAARMIGGMSAGGYCALNLGLRHRDVFGSILDLSGLDRPTHAGGMQALYGADAAARAVADSPGAYARALAPEPVVRVWLGYGAQDEETRGDVRRMAADLGATGFPVRLLVRPGFHTFHVWRPLTAQALGEAAPGLVAAAG